MACTNCENAPDRVSRRSLFSQPLPTPDVAALASNGEGLVRPLGLMWEPWRVRKPIARREAATEPTEIRTPFSESPNSVEAQVSVAYQRLSKMYSADGMLLNSRVVSMAAPVAFAVEHLVTSNAFDLSAARPNMQRLDEMIASLRRPDGSGSDPNPLFERILRDAGRDDEVFVAADSPGCVGFQNPIGPGNVCITFPECAVKFATSGPGWLGYGVCRPIGPDCICVSTRITIEEILLILLGLVIAGVIIYFAPGAFRWLMQRFWQAAMEPAL